MKKVRSKFHEGDFWIIVVTILLSLFGLVMVFSASYYTGISKYDDPTYFLKRNAMWVVVGLIVFFIVSFIDYHFWKKFSFLALVVGFGLLIAIFTPLGVTINNAARWLDFKIFTVMPGEVIKTCIILFFAWFYAYKVDLYKQKLKGSIVGLFVAAASFILIFIQPNLSTAGIVFLLCIGIMLIAGLSWWFIIVGLGAGAAGVAVLLIVKGGYMVERIDKFWDPFSDALGKGYQVSQGLLAFGSGGVTGLGLGKSVEKALYLPEAMNDFILPIIGEELGFIGVLALILTFIILIWRIFTIAMNSNDKFGLLAASGVAIHIALQVLLNIAVVTASFPPTGVVLPLISLGGTSSILIMFELGMVYNISKQTKVDL